MRVTAAGAGTLVDEVERLLEKATAAKSRTVRLADRAARLYAPVVHAAAALTCVGWLIAGASCTTPSSPPSPCSSSPAPARIALAIPAVQVVAAGQLFRSGVILNCGDAIERLAEADTVVFDKTGTLTLARSRRRSSQRSIPICWNARRGSRCRAIIRWRRRWRARRASARLIRARSKSRDAACAH